VHAQQHPLLLLKAGIYQSLGKTMGLVAQFAVGQLFASSGFYVSDFVWAV
jgi:hypothetical protein